LLGVRVSAAGLAGGPAFRSDRYQQTGEEKIEPQANPLPAHVTFRGAAIEPESIRDAHQTLNFRTGILRSAWTHEGTEIACETALAADRRALAQRWRFRGKAAHDYDVSGAQGSKELADSQPDERIIELSWGDGSYRKIANASEAAWQGRWQTDVLIDGPDDDQEAVRAALFYLRSAVHPTGSMSVAPFGLSNDTYFGHVFWDADLWVMPALAFIEPESAAAIARYRLERLAQARRNYQSWLGEGRPIANGQRVSPRSPRPAGGMKFPWESSVTGKETVPGPSRYQDHVTGTVAFAVAQAAALGLAPGKGTADLLRGARGFYTARTEMAPQGLVLRQTMSPDEHHLGDNDLYTNLVALWCLNSGRWQGSARVVLPRDAESLISYDGDRFRGYKQAAAMLAVYPLQYPEAETQAMTMLGRFENGVIANGPAMADAVHATVHARFGSPDDAYQVWRKDWQDFVKDPHLQFSEKRHRPVTYFTTGAGGSLQAVIYGFLGFRIDDKPLPGAKTIPLQDGKVLSIRPRLPRAWKRVVFQNFIVLSRRYTLTATHDRVDLRPEP
jgi:trehalose/maltose hydrolase-like predicted phosphorylase